jgi:hypothetical protein
VAGLVLGGLSRVARIVARWLVRGRAGPIGIIGYPFQEKDAMDYVSFGRGLDELALIVDPSLGTCSGDDWQNLERLAMQSLDPGPRDPHVALALLSLTCVPSLSQSVDRPDEPKGEPAWWVDPSHEWWRNLG